MTDVNVICEAWRPKIRYLAQGLAAHIRQEQTGPGPFGLFNSVAVLSLEGLFRDELVKALGGKSDE